MTETREFGNYQLIERLGRGGMGEVWRAKHKILDRQTAIKLIRAQADVDAKTLLLRFEREAQATSDLTSAHTVQLHDFGITADGIFYYTMEFLDGLDLKSLVEHHGPLPSERVIYLLLQVCESLAEAHHNGIMHRDIKPSNIFLCRRGLRHDFIKVLDFGLVKFTEAEESQISHVTTQGAAIGSPAFMAPETIKGDTTIDNRADIYSLGCLTYWLLTGQFIFQVETPLQILIAHLEQTPEPPSTRTELEIPEGLEQIIMACLEKDPDNRPQSVQTLSHQLEECTIKEPWTEERARRWWRIHHPSKTSEEGRRSRHQSGDKEITPLSLDNLSDQWIGPTRISSGRKWALTVAAALLLGGAATGLWIARAGWWPFAADQVAHNTAGSVAPARIRAIAVLPLSNLMGDPEQDYFVAGIHEAMIAELAQIQALTVISRTSVKRYKDTTESIPEIARELNVDALIEGSVLREDDNLRIAVQLIGTNPERHLWTDTYDGELRNVLALQSEVARAVAREIKVAVTPEERARLTSTRPVDPEVYEFYLKGRQLCNTFSEADWYRGTDYFRLAFEKDASYAPAYAGLARCYDNLAVFLYLAPEDAFPRAKSAVLRALELDGELGEAHATLGFTTLLSDWDWFGPKEQFERALELEPNSVTSMLDYGWYLTVTEQFDEAVTIFERAIQLDPLAPTTLEYLAWANFVARRYDESIIQLEKMRELDPDSAYAHMLLAWNYTKKQMFTEALAEAEKAEALTLASDDQTLLSTLGWVNGAAGRKGKAREFLRQLTGLSPQRWVDPGTVALIYAGLGEVDLAFHWLNKAYQEHSMIMVILKTSPLFDNLRQDPRFTRLLDQLGLAL
jgi:serine/threonine protein kinase/TolB-like protein/tetratricopeptide (TPR) repeat protein